jgi:hypothetical protein
VKYSTPEEIVRANHDAARPRIRLGFGLCAFAWLIAFAGFRLGFPFLFFVGAPILLVGSGMIMVTWYRVLTLKERPRG